MKFNKNYFLNNKYNAYTIISVAFLVVIILLYLFTEDPKPKEKNYSRYLIEDNQYELLDDHFMSMINQDSTNIELYRTFIQDHFSIPESSIGLDYSRERDDSRLYVFLLSKSESFDPILRDVGYYALGQYFSEQQKYPEALERYDNIYNRNLKYLNNSIGYCLMQIGKYDSSETYFLKEIQNKGNLEGAYDNLIDLYLFQKDGAKMKQLIQDGKKGYFSHSQLTDYYYQSGKVIPYIYCIFISPFLDFHFLTFFGAFIIVLFWVFYLRKLDIFAPEKWKYLIFIFLISAFLTPFTLILYDLVHYKIHFYLNGTFLNDLTYSILCIGLIEESIKLIPFLLFLKLSKQIDEPIDYIIYASISALGFAFVENLIYFNGYGLELMHGRGLISAVIHMFCSSVIGYGLSIGFTQKKSFVMRLLFSLLIASAVHGIFDFWLISETYSILSFFSVIVFVLCVSAWNTMINNAINYSIPNDSDLSYFSIKKIQNYLILGLSTLLLVEYILISLQLGPTTGRSMLLKSIFSGSYIIIFLSATMSSFNIKKNRKGMFLPELREIRPKINQLYQFQYHSAKKYDIFPCSGVIIEQKNIEYDNTWYLVQLDQPIENYEVCADHVMIQLLKTGKIIDAESMGDPIIMAGIFMIKDIQVLMNHDIMRKDLYFCAWVRLDEILTP